jgi:hypothetical protein
MINGSKFGMQEPMIDGMRVGFGGGSFMTLAYPDTNTEEINLGITNVSAEAETGGVRVNIIPRSGGNQLTGALFGSFTNEALQSDNLDDELRARGLTAVDSIDYLSDVSAALGGRSSAIACGSSAATGTGTPSDSEPSGSTPTPRTGDTRRTSPGIRRSWIRRTGMPARG